MYYDKKWDALRLSYERKEAGVEFSVGRRRIIDRDWLNHDQSERIVNYVLTGFYQLRDWLRIDLFEIIRNDRTEDRDRPIFSGVRFSGEPNDALRYWLDLAHVRGREGSNRVRGTGLDLGATYTFDKSLKPVLIFGYAFGTGDRNTSDGSDHNFRQTGLHDNSDKLTGVTSVNYYGELFDPELSNLSIFTLGAGIRPTHKSSVEVIFHNYLQQKGVDTIRRSSLDMDPNGQSKDLGREVDLVIGYREIENIDLEFKWGYFFPGSAFSDEADGAVFVKARIRIDF